MTNKDEPRIEFKYKDEDGNMIELLRLDTKGMLYKGQYIQDAGEAHDAFIATMHTLEEAKGYLVDRLTVFAFGFAAGYALCYWGLS